MLFSCPRNDHGLALLDGLVFNCFPPRQAAVPTEKNETKQTNKQENVPGMYDHRLRDTR